VEKLLLTPTEQLKSVNDPETVGTYSEALTRLFGLEQKQPAPAASPDQPEDRQERRDRRVEPFVRPGKR